MAAVALMAIGGRKGRIPDEPLLDCSISTDLLSNGPMSDGPEALSLQPEGRTASALSAIVVDTMLMTRIR